MSRVLGAIRVLIGTLMLVAVLINFSNVVGRYAFSKPILWADEAMVFLQIWCVFLGAPLVSFANAHLRMDAFEHFAPPGLKRWFDVLTELTMLVVALIIMGMALVIVAGMVDTDQRTIALEIPMAIPYLALPIGFLLIALVAVTRILWLVRRGWNSSVPASTPDPT